MSDEVRKYHEEDAIGKTYDFRVARRLFRYLKPYWRLAAGAIALTLLTNVLISTQPYFTKLAVDDFITPKRTDGIWYFALAFFGVFLFRFIFSYAQEILLNNVGQRVMFDLRTELFTKLQKQEIAYYDQYPVGRIMTRLTSDVDALNELFTSGVIDVLGDLVVIFAIIGMMFWLDWKLAIISLLTVPLLFAATNWFRKHARKGFDMVRTRNARLNAFLQEYISGAQTVQLFNAEGKARARFREINDDYRNANVTTIYYYAIFYPLVDFIGAVGIAVVILAFGYETLSGITAAGTVLTVGILASFIQYSLQLFQPIRDLSDKFNVLQAAIVASHRIFILLDREVAIESPAEPKSFGKAEGKIEFQNVWFAYKNEDWVLKNVSFKVDLGESIALVGHTGSGKTTITNLLMRFYDVQKGTILLDGVDVRDWDLHDLRSNFAVVLQDVFLFSGTIENNIKLGNAEIDRTRVEWAASEVHADAFIEHLNEGFDSEVRERGAGLSVGQKQLISFARALAFDPTILILDEATSSIDTETEQLIQQAVERVMTGRTSLVVAHRLSTIQKCDRIIVLHHGELVESGSHNELLANRGLYWRLYQLQYSEEHPRFKTSEPTAGGFGVESGAGTDTHWFACSTKLVYNVAVSFNSHWSGMNDNLEKISDSTIGEIYARCHTEAPNYGVTLDAFSSSIRKTTEKYLIGAAAQPVSTEELTEFLDQLQSEELFLAIACANGNERAWWEFDQQHRAYMERVARHLAKTDIDAQEVIDCVYVELYGTRVVDGERMSKFASYSGRGSLRGWLRTVIWHSLVDLHRASHDEVSLDEMTETVGEGAAQATFLEAPAGGEEAMIEQIARDRYRKATVAAIETSFDSLETHEKLLLQYYHVENLKLREIARLVENEKSPLRGWFQRKSQTRERDPASRIHESTVMRWLEKSYAKVTQAFSSELRDKYGLKSEEVTICLRLATEDLAGPGLYSRLTAK